MTNETITDSNGQGIILNLVNGQELPITITKEGFGIYSDTITVDKDNLNMNVTLYPIILLTYDASIDRTFSSNLSNPFVHTGDITIDWGDGTVETFDDTYLNHTYNDDNIYQIKINGNITEIKDGGWDAGVVRGCFKSIIGITSVLISSIERIGGETFTGCSNITNVILSPSVTSLGDECFGGCVGLTSFDLHNISYVGRSCFIGCTGLTEMSLANSVDILTYFCFMNCSNLISIDIPSSVKTFEGMSFNGCTNLINYNLYWTSSEDIVEYTTDNYTINENTVFNIPNGTSDLYIAKNYPSERLVERND